MDVKFHRHILEYINSYQWNPVKICVNQNLLENMRPISPNYETILI